MEVVLKILGIIFNIGLVIPWQLFKIYLEYYFGRLAFRYLKVLNFDRKIKEKRALCLIFLLTGVPAFVWLSQLVVAIILLVQWLQFSKCSRAAWFYQAIVDILFEIIIEM